MSAEKTNDKPKDNRSPEAKWGKELTVAGYTVLPNVLIHRQKALGLDPVDMNIILHICSHWWSKDDLPFPSKAKMSEALSVHSSTIQRRIAAMEKAGFIERIVRTTKEKGRASNYYNLDGLIKKSIPFALEEQDDRQRKIAGKKARDKKKRPQKTHDNA